MSFQGLLKARKALVVYARGLDYMSKSTSTPADGYDFQKPYMERWLRFVGVTEIGSIVVEKTLFGAATDVESRTQAREQAVALAAEF